MSWWSKGMVRAGCWPMIMCNEAEGPSQTEVVHDFAVNVLTSLAFLTDDMEGQTLAYCRCQHQEFTCTHTTHIATQKVKMAYLTTYIYSLWPHPLLCPGAHSIFEAQWSFTHHPTMKMNPQTMFQDLWQTLGVHCFCCSFNKLECVGCGVWCGVFRTHGRQWQGEFLLNHFVNGSLWHVSLGAHTIHM